MVCYAYLVHSFSSRALHAAGQGALWPFLELIFFTQYQWINRFQPGSPGHVTMIIPRLGISLFDSPDQTRQLISPSRSKSYGQSLRLKRTTWRSQQLWDNLTAPVNFVPSGKPLMRGRRGSAGRVALARQLVFEISEITLLSPSRAFS